jgi:multidrug efflux pump subunit AcrB
VLGISLIESLFILPNHLTHLRPPHQPATGRVFRFFGALQNRVDRGLKRFVEGPLSRALRFSTEAPGVVIAAGVALIVLSVATVPAGWVRIQFFPEVEGDIVSAQLEMPEGTSAAVTTEFVGRIEAAAYRAGAALEAERDGSLPDLIEGVRLSVGSLPAEQGPRGADAGVSRLQSHLASVEVRLLGAEDREIAATAFEQMWRDELGSVDGVRSLTFASALLAIGAAVQVEITHPDPARLEAVGASLVDELSSFEGVFEVETDRDQGLQEVQLRLKPAARSMGLTLEGLARQVRGAFFGDEALRVQKGREDVRVYVRLPEGERDGIADIEQYYIQLPGGGEAPLGAVAEATIGSSPTSIQRKNGQRVLTITADVDPLVVTGQELSGQLEDEILPQLAAIDPLLSYSFGGEQQEQAESFSAMGKGFLLALLVMYALLAVPFRSYVQPLIIMSAIPFGVIGAMLAHLAMGLPLGILSLFGIIGLSGVVVNDSLVMIDFINELKGRGMEYNEAIVMGAKQRFRPIFLTSVTTFLGVAPLVFETSLQAQFLIPMAASLGFGTLFATAILMVLVPALATVEHRAEVWFRRVVMGRQAS